MGNTARAENRRFPLLWLIPVLLPVLYLGLLGPLSGLNARGLLPEFLEIPLSIAYLPIGLIGEFTGFFERPPGAALIWYIDLFEP